MLPEGLAQCARWLEQSASQGADAFPVVRNAIADFVLCARYATAHPSPATAAMLADPADGEFIVVGSPTRAARSRSVFLNAYLAHSHDFDDHCLAGIVHSSACILPTLLTRFETGAIDGRQLVEAFRVASEATFFIGEAFGDALYRRGWFNSTIFGVFGACMAAVLAAGRKPTSHLAAAYELSHAHFFGTRHVLGGIAKPIAVGHAAMLGASLGDLLGRQDPPLRIEARGRPDFLALVLPEGERKPMPAPALKQRLLDPGLDLKTAPYCLSAFPFLNLGVALRRLSGDGTWERIESASFEVSPRARANLLFGMPGDDYEAPFSAPAAFVFGACGIEALEPARTRALLAQGKILENAFLTRPEWDATPFNAAVTVRFRDGQSLRLAESDPHPARARMEETGRIWSKAERFVLPANGPGFERCLATFLESGQPDSDFSECLRALLRLPQHEAQGK